MTSDDRVSDAPPSTSIALFLTIFLTSDRSPAHPRPVRLGRLHNPIGEVACELHGR